MEEKRKRKYEEGKIIMADPHRFVSAIRLVPSSKKQRTLENERNAIMSFQGYLNQNARHKTPVPIYEGSWKEALTRNPDENVLTAIQQGQVPVYNKSWKKALQKEVGGKKRRTRKHRNTKKSKRKISSKKKFRKSKK